jgi:ComEC/Rec2-related protein
MALRATCPPSWRIVASAPACRRLSQNHGSWWLTRCYEVRREGAALLALGIEDFPETVGLLRALLLGHRSQLQRDIRDAFVMTGTLHIFAISGLHVAIVAYLITAVLQAVRVPRTHWAVLVVPLLIGYTWATGARASAIRACVMGSVYVCAPLLQRKPDVICSLALSALVIVAAAPLQLIDVGFILSFVAVLGIVGLYPVFEQPLRPLWTPDPLRVAPVPRWTAALRAVARYVGSLVSVSCAAWFASTPLTALYFGRFIPVALLGNLLAVPVSFLVTVCGALSFVLGSCVPVLADLFNHANVALVFLMVRPMQVFSAIPGGSIRMDRVPLAAVLLWYAVMIGLSVLVRTKALDRPDATVPS